MYGGATGFGSSKPVMGDGSVLEWGGMRQTEGGVMSDDTEASDGTGTPAVIEQVIENVVAVDPRVADIERAMQDARDLAVDRLSQMRIQRDQLSNQIAGIDHVIGTIEGYLAPTRVDTYSVVGGVDVDATGQYSIAGPRKAHKVRKTRKAVKVSQRDQAIARLVARDTSAEAKPVGKLKDAHVPARKRLGRPPLGGQPWTDAQDQVVIAKASPDRQIATELKRSVSSIGVRRAYLKKIGYGR